MVAERWTLVALVLASAACARGGAGAALPSEASTPARAVPARPSASPSASAVADATQTPGSGERAGDPLAGEAILADATFLASPEFRGRGSATDDEARAGKWLAARLDAAHVATLAGKRIVPFEFGASARKSANVLGTVEPPGASPKQPVIVLGAHHDHLGVRGTETFWGAEDNASGAALVLAVARALEKRKAELGAPVVVAFFGAEEVGLRGSHAFVESWPFAERPVSLMVNVDMIGRSLADQPILWVGARALGILKDVDRDKAVGVLLPESNRALVERVRRTCDAEGVKAVTIGDLPASLRPALVRLSTGRGDHYFFEKRGIPFVFFSSSESSDYHTPTDTADKLDAGILERRARAILRFVLESSKPEKLAMRLQ